MKKSILLLCLPLLFINKVSGQGCDDDIQTVFNLSEGAISGAHVVFSWGKATKLIADHYDCKDKMEEYAGGGAMQAFLYNTSWGGGVNVPTSANISGQTWNLIQGSFNSGYSWTQQVLDVDAIAAYTKLNYPQYIDGSGRFILDVLVPVRKGGVNNQFTYYHHALIIWTNYRINQLSPNFSCEGDTVNFNQLFTTSPTFQNVTVTASAPFQATPTPGVYVGGNLGSTLNQSATFSATGTYTIPTENMTPASYPHAGFVVSCFFYWNNGGWNQASLSNLKTLHLNRTFNYTLYNRPSAMQTGTYPSPLWNNDPAFLINSNWSAEGFTSYIWSGGAVLYDSGSNLYSFTPSVGAGQHTITLTLDNAGKCQTTIESSVIVQTYPGTPAKPRLDYLSSFDYSTDSAIRAGGCLAPGYYDFNSGGFVVDASLYERHKYLCPREPEDSMELFILSPQSNLTYYWKRVVNGLEMDLGSGTSKKIVRMHDPAPNVGTTYKEYVFFRSKNIVNNYSPWEYVELEYPVIPYVSVMPNSPTSLYLIDTICHDSGSSYQVFNNLLTSESFLGFDYTNVGGQQNYIRSYEYSDWNSSSTLNNSGNFTYDWIGTKIDTFSISESAKLRTPLSSCWVDFDWCKCKIRDLDVVAVKNPEITSISGSADSLDVGEYGFFDVNIDWNGSAQWYLDSVGPPYNGNSIVLTGFGSQGDRDMYIIARDVYGCFDDTLRAQIFYVNGLTFTYTPVVDSVNAPGFSEEQVCISVEKGGNVILTPNSDGLNDLINICEYRDYSMQIFDRWGNLVMNPTNQSQIDLSELSKSTYYYILKNAVGERFSGFIEIIK